MNKRSQSIEYITQDIITYLVEDSHIDFINAMHLFYTSSTYEKLLDEETGLYLEGSAYIYDIFKEECQHGHLVQNEY